MTTPPTNRDNDTATIEDHQQISTGFLLTTALARLRTATSAILVLGIAGIIATGIDQLQLHDPIPTVGFTGIQDGQFSITFEIGIAILSRANVPLSALIDLKLKWLAWTIGLELLGFTVVVGAGAIALARLLDVSLTVAAVSRYTATVMLLQGVSGNLHFEGGAMLLAVPLFILGFLLVVRLFALPGLLIAGYPIRSALRWSWRLADGHGWSLFGVILIVGGLNHLLASTPFVGAFGSAFVAMLHAGTVAAFLRATNAV